MYEEKFLFFTCGKVWIYKVKKMYVEKLWYFTRKKLWIYKIKKLLYEEKLWFLCVTNYGIMK